MLAARAEAFTTEELRAWVTAATAAAEAWSKRNYERHAGSDLLDAQRGVYDLVATYRLVELAIAYREGATSPR